MVSEIFANEYDSGSFLYKNLWRAEVETYVNSVAQVATVASFLIKNISLPSTYQIEYETSPLGQKFVKSINRESDFDIEFYLDGNADVLNYLQSWFGAKYQQSANGDVIGAGRRDIRVYLQTRKSTNLIEPPALADKVLYTLKNSVIKYFDPPELTYEDGTPITLKAYFTCDIMTITELAQQ